MPNPNEDNNVLDEIILKDTKYKTPGFLEFERRNTLVNKIRSEFFGEELSNGNIADVLEGLHTRMADEFAAAEKELKGYSVKSYSSAIAEAEKKNKTNPKSTPTELEESGKRVKEASEAMLQKRKDDLETQYQRLTNMLGWLQRNRNAELTLDQYREWASEMNSWANMRWFDLNADENLAVKKPERGLAEIQLNSICTSIGNMMAARVSYEQENRFTVPLANQYMKDEWIRRIQAYFANPDFEHSSESYGSGVEDTKYVKKNLESRLGEAVTAIYTGKLILPGLKIGNYWENDSTAPYETAQELLETLGGFPFLSEAARRRFLSKQMGDDYNAWKENNEHRYAQQEAVTAVMERGDFKALSKLESGSGNETVPEDLRKWFLGTAEQDLIKDFSTHIKDIRAGKKDKEGELVKWEGFDTLNKIKENTKAQAGNEGAWNNISAKYEDEDVKGILSKQLKLKEEELYKELSEPFLQDQFTDRIKKYWKGQGISDDRISAENGRIYTGELEKAIAASLCSAHLSDEEIKKGETTKNVLPLFRQPKLPIDQESIEETVDYFKKMLGKAFPKATDAFETAFSDVTWESIKERYDQTKAEIENAKTSEAKAKNNGRNMKELIREELKNDIRYKERIDRITANNKIAMKEGNLLSPEQYIAPWKMDKATEETIKTAAGEMKQKQEEISIDMSKQFVELLKIGQENNRKMSRKDLLSTLLEGVSGEKDASKAKKNLMKSADSLKRGWWATLWNKNLNKAGSKLRKMLNDISAKAPGEEISPEEMRELNNTAKALKESIDHGGKTLTNNEIKKLKEIDQNRYTMALKVLDTLEKKMMKGGMLFEKETELMAEKQPDATNKAPTNLTM